MEIQSGSFFETVPAGADVYLLSHIIHDWREDLCLTILGHCRRAMNPGGRVLIVEMVLPPADTPHPGKMLDVMMLVGPGGQERTAQEYEASRQGGLPSQSDCANGVRRERRRGIRRVGWEFSERRIRFEIAARLQISSESRRLGTERSFSASGR